eukprot:9050564-Pyramimonas_sp.AAC.1
MRPRRRLSMTRRSARSSGGLRRRLEPCPLAPCRRCQVQGLRRRRHHQTQVRQVQRHPAPRAVRAPSLSGCEL